MTFEDDRTHSHCEEQRIDHLAEWLEVTLGSRLTAYAVGVSPADIARFAHGAGEPGREAERRLRNLYTATWFVASSDGPGSAHDWLTEPNPKLENRAPAELLRAGRDPAPAWFLVSPAF
ncbi:MAG: hypothetical protein NVS2B6_00340 [Thermoleophilaceae bacterium]